MGIIETTINNMTLEQLEKDKPSTTSVKPTLTKKIVEGVVELLKDIEDNNGYHSIAVKHSITDGQVKWIHSCVDAKISELTVEEIV